MSFPEYGPKIRKTKNPLVPWYKPTVVPPSYHNDTLPTHRIAQSEWYLRLGDCQFFIPPLFIEVNTPSATQRVATIRQSESTQTNSGYSGREINITLWFNDLEQINGTPMDSGVDGVKYYMDGLRSMVAQFKKLPFVPVVNELLNDVYRIYAATLVNITFQTVDSMPGCLQAQLSLKEFNAMPYLGVPTTCYEGMFCWPMFRWFYQQQLIDGPSYSATKLPKITTANMTGNVKFKMLPESFLALAPPESSGEANADNRYEYISNEWAFMEGLDMEYDKLIIKDMTISLANIVTDLQLADHQAPTHQFLGSLDTLITMNIITDSRALAQQLVEMHDSAQKYSRVYKNKIVTGYIGIENELVNMMGVDCVTIQNFNLTTVEAQPDLLNISITFLSYNKTQKDSNTPSGMTPYKNLAASSQPNTFMHPTNILNENIGMVGKDADDYHKPMVWDGVLEDMIADMELYPDLQLPSYKVVNNVIVKINKSRESKGLMPLGIDNLIPPIESKANYVDPDFYMFYPSPIALGIIDADKFNDFWNSYNSGGAAGIIDQTLKNKSNLDLMNAAMQLIADCNKYGDDYLVPANLALDDGTQDVPPVKQEDLYKLMMHDMFCYSKRHTMCRAFPTALFMFMDEGQRVRGVRLLNNLYAYNAIVDISVYRDRDNPIDVCQVQLANIYHSLSTKQNNYDADKKSFFGTIFVDVDEEMIRQRTQIFKFMDIEAGCRVHIRMGYGSSPWNLPIVFNGIVTEIDAGPVLTMYCQSDGHELTNPIYGKSEDQTTGMFNFGKEPSDIIGSIMTDRAGWEGAFTWTGMMKEVGDFVNESKYGIEHFGYVYAKDGFVNDIQALFHVGSEGRMSYDVLKNVYLGVPYTEDKGTKQRTTKKTWSLLNPTGQENVYLYIDSKTPWDVFKALAAANSEYIVTSSPHNFRSTLFFGQPIWLYKSGWLYTGEPNLESRKDVNNYYEKIKTYSQVHCIDSTLDIIDNGVIASTKGVITAVIPTYTEGNKVKTDMILYADKNIYPEYQKTAYYDTSFMQDYLGPEFLYTAVRIETSFRNARRAGMSYLQHSFKDMYKGQLIVIGDPSIKPYDVIHLTDSYKEMYGQSYVGAVTHSMSIDQGFVSSIKLDMITLTETPFSTGLGSVLSTAGVFATNFQLARGSITGCVSITKTIDYYAKRVERRPNLLLRFAVDAAGGGMAAVYGMGVLSLCTGGLILLAAAAGWIIMDRCYEWYQKVFEGRDDHTISAMPMMCKNRPFMGALKGHQTLLPGYSDEVQNKATRFDAGTSELTAQIQAQQEVQNYNAIITGVNARKQVGVNIFDLQTNGYDADDATIAAYYGGGGGGNGPGGGTNDALAQRMIDIAKTYIGTPYQYGSGPGDDEFDCSEFVWHVTDRVGIGVKNITNNTVWEGRGNTISQIEYLESMNMRIDSASDLKPGDLIYQWGTREDGTYGPVHVQIYIGNNEVIEATPPKVAIHTFKVNSTDKYYRIPELVTSSGGIDENGTIDGKPYVYKLPQSICTLYNEGEGMVGGHGSAGGYKLKADGKYCAAHNIKTGTKIYIPALKHLNTTGEYIVADTGGPFYDFDLNLPSSVSNFKDPYDVYILEWGNGVQMQSFESAIAEQKQLGQWDGPKEHYSGSYSKYYGQFVTENWLQPGITSKK